MILYLECIHSGRMLSRIKDAVPLAQPSSPLLFTRALSYPELAISYPEVALSYLEVALSYPEVALP